MLISKTPLRLPFFSGGSDMPAFYQKELGAAFSATIDKYIYVFLHNSPHTGVRIMYDTIEDYPDIEQMQHLITKEALKHFGYSKEITIASISDILSKGSGLGSSSTFTVGLVNCLASSKWEVASKEFLADVACEIEMNKCGYPVGKQDQYAAAYGGFNLFEFDKNGKVKVTKPFISKETVSRLEKNLLLVYSGKGRSANSILQKQQKAMDDSVKFNLAKKNRDKAYSAVRFLENGNIDSFGNLLHEAWMDKKQIVDTITEDYFDYVYNKAINSGALGGKLLGAGGGGFFIFYVPPDKRDYVIESITKDTECKVYPFEFSGYGSRIVMSTDH